jgi:hypothetical protein
VLTELLRFLGCFWLSTDPVPPPSPPPLLLPPPPRSLPLLS